MDQIIRARGLGKKYRGIAASRAGDTINEAIPRMLARLFGRGGLSRVDGNLSSEERWVLKDVSFDVYPGEVVGIIGRNGAGKSTLLKILSRVTCPSEGTLEFRGRIGSLLETGTGFHGELSGRDNVFLSGSILGMSREEIRSKFERIVEFAEMAEYLDIPVKHYSSGMYVRLAFSVAAHLDPEVLVIDEVLAVGDVQFQRKCMDKIRDVTKNGMTILLVSHNINAVMALCTKAILLESGKIVASGSVYDCVNLYSGIAAQGPVHAWRGDVGDENIRLYEASITSGDGRFIFKRGDVFFFEFTYEVMKESPLIVVGVDFLAGPGMFVCATRYTDVISSEKLATLQCRGRHKVRLCVETSILAEGDYAINVNLGLHNIRRIVEAEPTLSFSIVNPAKNFDHDAAGYRSIVYPDWVWEDVP